MFLLGLILGLLIGLAIAALVYLDEKKKTSEITKNKFKIQ